MLNIAKLSHTYGDQPVLHDIDLQITDGEIFCLLGPSGCGKTTLLRCLAGLEQPDRGSIVFDRQSLIGIPVHQRDLGFMFQELALFPHMNVRKNVAFGLKMKHVEAPDTRVQEVLQLVGLADFGDRDTSQLSGGERQRVALARSLAPNPRLLMLDEPLGALDAALRSRLVLELRQIIKQIGLTSIFVTHDQQEAFAIADRIAIMNAGQIEQIDTPQSLYGLPQTTFAARFLGLNNIVPVDRYANGQAITPLGAFALAEADDYLLVHPSGIEYDPQGMLSGQLIECVFQGETYRLTLEHESGITLSFNQPARSGISLKEGDNVRLTIAPDSVIPLTESSARGPARHPGCAHSWHGSG